MSCVQLGRKLSDWFEVTAGVRQGDSLSPLLFTIFINDLTQEIDDCNVGVYMGGEQLSLLMYANDIVLISGSESAAQRQLDVMTSWCNRWDMQVNPKKSQI